MTIAQYTAPMVMWDATDAGFRKWGKTWTDMLTTMGITEVYSNIDWATVLMPTTATYAGKRVYKFDDSQSATREIYFSVEFGRGNISSADHGFAIKITVGISHDGSGGISGYSFSEHFTMVQAPTDGGEIIGVKTSLGFSIWTNINNGAKFQAGFSLERLAENGQITPDGVVLLISGQGNVTYGGTYACSAFWRAANYAAGLVYAVVGPNTSASSIRTFQNVQAILDSVDPSYAGKAPAILMDTFGKYDPCYHWILVNKNLYSPATEFNAVINGTQGTYRIPVTGFLGENGSTGTNRLYVALKVA